MVEETVPALAETNSERVVDPVTEDMELETLDQAQDPKQDNGGSETNGVGSETNGTANSKRWREDDATEEIEDGSKKQKVEEKSMEEDRLEKSEEGTEEGEKKESRVSLGPKVFVSSVEMFDYFYKFLHYWPPNLNVNKYEHMALLDLIMKGSAEPEKKIGNGVQAFQVRYHPMFKSRCFFIIRKDESVDDFSFRKCVHHILPLPENMIIKSDANKALGGGRKVKGGGGGGRGGGRVRGRGGKWRN